MKTCVVGNLGSLIVLGLALLLNGCPGPGTTGGGGKSAAGGKGSGDELSSKIGEYMPPLDGGKLEIAAPKGWDWANPGGDVLVAFKPKDAEINSLPRVLLSVAESDSVGIHDVTPENVNAFVKQVSDSLPEPKPKEPVRAVTLGKHHFARYVTFGKRRNQVVAQQTLQTAVGGRAYTLRLEVYQHQFEKYQWAVSAVAASMKFAAEGAEAELPEATPATEKAEPDQPAEKPAEGPDEEPAEKSAEKPAKDAEAKKTSE